MALTSRRQRRPGRSISPTRFNLRRSLTQFLNILISALQSLETSFDPKVTLGRLRKHTWAFADAIYIFHAAVWTFWLTLMPGYPYKLFIPILYIIALLLPITSQFFLPALPVLSWAITFFSSRFIPATYRPTISVSVLPTLESVLYGANISDILTRFTHPFLDILAWIPYGIVHFAGPAILAAALWLFAPRKTLQFWARMFGYMNLTGVFTQIIFPCAAPWYELIYGLTPANYSMPGSPGGLARIDALFHSKGYTNAFSASPVVFGAFPSLHAGWATLEALVISHFFPRLSRFAWGYTGILYWATMYLTHHYLIDVVGGACLATAFFYFMLPAELRDPAVVAAGSAWIPVSKHEQYDLEAGPYRASSPGLSSSLSLSSTEEDGAQFATYRSPNSLPNSGVPFLSKDRRDRRSHKHTASIAHLIRAEERDEDGWSPVRTSFAGDRVATLGERRGGEEASLPRARSPAATQSQP